MSEQDGGLRVERVRDIVVATLDRAAKRNALSDPMFDALLALQHDVSADDTVRALVLTGDGPGFCAGIDLDLAAGLPRQRADEFLRNQERWSNAITGFHRLSVPVIAAVNGPAAGAGFALALACDLRVASRSARFNAAFVRVGLSAGDCGTSWFLPRIVGHGRAAELMFTGRFIDADEALTTGLVSDVVADGLVLARALELADAIGSNSPFAMRMTKQVMRTSFSAVSLETAVEVENRTQVLASRTEDMREALEAFRERREPKFIGH